MSARTRSSRASTWPARSRSSSTRKARWPSASAPAAPASRPSSPRPASARWSPRARRYREFDGETYVMERGIVGDLAIVKAWKGDHEGNLVYRKTARNFNPMMATAGKVMRRRGRGAGRARRDRSGPHPHARHLRRPHRPGPELREADRAAHRPQARRLKTRRRIPSMAWTTGRDGGARRARSCATASTSISASASRRWWRTTSRQGSR